MDKRKYNSEGYYDPTAYGALATMERKRRVYRPMVYICSPYAGDVEANVKAAQGYCRYAVDMGCIPIAPHLLFPQFLNDNIPDERELAMFFGKILMDKCMELWVFGDRITTGMQSEIDRAMRKNYRVRYFMGVKR